MELENTYPTICGRLKVFAWFRFDFAGVWTERRVAGDHEEFDVRFGGRIRSLSPAEVHELWFSISKRIPKDSKLVAYHLLARNRGIQALGRTQLDLVAVHRAPKQCELCLSSSHVYEHLR